MKCYFLNLRALFYWLMILGVGLAHAGLTDLANVPMANTSSSVVKPNVMFILDDSGSMAWEYTPNEAENFDSAEYGSKSSQCNGLYYNPAINYVPPVDSTGTSYPNASFTAAKDNGFSTATSPSTTNLNNQFYFAYTGTQKALGFTYNSSGTVITTTDFYKECDSDVGSSPGNSKFTKVTITTASSDTVKTNFANWYSYYRSRMLTMKSAAGRAFKDIGDSYRVGFTTINNTGTDSSDSEYLAIGDFNSTQKASWYSKFYAVTPNAGTPLRAALSKVGRIYAGQLGTDPVQYSCQQNFAILSTDGYWNGAAGYQADGTTAIGNQDGTLARPMFDGSVTSAIYRATVTVNHNANYPNTANSNTKVSSITVNGVEIMTSTSNGDNDRNDLATKIKNRISKNGYAATVSGRVITITAPASAGVVTGVTPVVTRSEGNMVITAEAFTVTSSSSGGSSDSLADVAAYYYNTDLRTNMENNVPGAGGDSAPHQHMTTFTLGLGVNGVLQYADGYATATSGDYYDIKQGTKNWPVPEADKPSAIDDLWHAAVNGHGTYYSAQSPDSLVSGISKALAGVSARNGSAAAAATSNLEPVAGDNFVYIALYRTVNWDGDLQAKTIDPSTGALSDTASWAAQSLLDAKVAASTDTRTIYKFDSSVTASKMKTFEWLNLSADEKKHFNDVCIVNATNPKTLLSQCDDLTTAQQGSASGANLVNFIRGQHQHEDRGSNTDKLYRVREHVLGDMINSQPVYVKQPPFAYTDENYSAYKSKRSANGDARVYVAVNDGMLHAFNGGTTDGTNVGGVEEWAYIPPMVMPNLYKLADKNYSSPSVKQYYVDGSPTAGDVCPGAPSNTCTANQWKTILVGGLNAGGRGYYALDVTDPDSPKALWNYTVENDEDLGYTYGNPVITKRSDGTWVVVFSSGYNNVSPGDGRGHLYVLNAYTGVRLEKISTSAGSPETPSGLAKINAWIESVTDNTAKRFYGGDLLGNVWRFDIDNLVPPSAGDGKEATLIGELGNVSPVGIQPITTKPELSEIIAGGSRIAVISVGTGRYLGVSDVGDASQQSIYTFKDNLTSTGLGKLRTTGTLVKQTLTTNAAGTKRVSSTNEVDWANKAGWYIDLPSPGERVNVDMQLQLGTLTVAGNVPENNACNLGGYAWLYNFDFMTGKYVAGATGGLTGTRLTSNSLVAGLKTIKLTSGKTTTLVTGTDGGISSEGNPSSGYGSAPNGKRVSWRELID